MKKLLLLTALLVHTSNTYGQSNSLSYKKTSNQSLSKYQRIAVIEEYLSKLKKNIQAQAKQGQDQTTLLLKNITQEVNQLKEKIVPINKQLKRFKSFEKSLYSASIDKLEKGQEIQKKSIEQLQLQVTSIEATLRSFGEFIETKKQQQRNK